MVSRLRRRARRYRYGVYLKGIGTRLRGKVSVREIPWCLVRDYQGEPKTLLTIRMDSSISLQAHFHERAREGAEKSCRTRRRKRGLRKNKRRSRVRHTRRSAVQPATDSKAQSSRKVNHIGRKYIWAVKASNNLRVDCLKLNKFPRGQLDFNHPARAPRLRMKKHCLVKWTRLHKQATVAGIHPTAAFHKSFWDYLMIETPRGDPLGGLDAIVGGLRLLKEEDDRLLSISSGSVYVTPPGNRPGRGGRRIPTKNKKRACRACGYFGPVTGHNFDACRR